MSAMPSMATESVRRNKPTRCADFVEKVVDDLWEQ
jgi:hypothetical protein